ncbi:toll/interleukin-1 receptor domain-containing protein [Bradyrhizobium sp. Arg62]|uniref:toll/interleukin-1 receptor domain-containing protein n=1 Tax=Bradyrhizobium brasilense TaxID=1419277 RepID=UPI001E5A93D6|nr:toll/interleukin-1 receptor domain-containing protein [Bradyrhizobium brasilense]MCC8948176.1 toll/interleukin-1 receptor domain-containing protein [Bradyrhizobium brasilense]
MKIFVIGGATVPSDHQDYDGEVRILNASMERIGSDVVGMGHDLVACSPFSGSADLPAVRGAISALPQSGRAAASIEIHCPAAADVLSVVAGLTGPPPYSDFRLLTHPVSAGENGKPNWEYTWLLSQLAALQASHAVVAIGGKQAGPANLLLSLAVTQSKPILPLAFLGGAAAQCLQTLRWPLDDLFKDRLASLYRHECVDFAMKLVEELAATKTAGRKQGDPPRFFISYPRDRPAEADYIETTLRRRSLDVFRDERDFGAGRDLPHEVVNYIERSNVFVVVWSKEYACSPWCYDELELALKRHKEGKTQLWIMCVDETRIVPPGARRLLNFPSRTREQIERHLLSLLEKSEAE